MSESRKFSCFLMGSQSRLIQCGELLLQKGHQVCGVISDEPSIRRWTKEKNLREIVPDDDIVELLKQQPFDIFFSIDNILKVPDDILTLPRKYAINFHDASLPAYAGVNATNWALINGETVHDVTWHLMTGHVDAGDILKKKTFPISDGETALTLNAKCYEEGIQCFAELIDELAEERVKQIRQNLDKRTYYARWKRPPAACVIDWSRSAEDIHALFRGLDHGSYPNPLGLPKLFLGNEAVIVKQIEVLASRSGAAQGTITLLTDKTIHVATATAEVALGELTSFKGETLSPTVLPVTSGLHEGDILPQLEGERADTITRINSTLCKHEDFWKERLTCLEPIGIPYAKRHALTAGPAHYQKERFPISPESMLNQESCESPGDFILAAFALYLSRIGDKTHYDVYYRDTGLQQGLAGTEAFFSSHVPLRVEVDYPHKVREFYKSLQEQVASVRAHVSYARDLVFRHQPLRDVSLKLLGRSFPVALERVTCLTDDHPKCDAELLVIIPDDGKECVWLYDEDVLDKPDIDRMREQFTVMLNDITTSQDRPVAELSILPEHERGLLLKDWNDTQVDYPGDTCLHGLFESQVEKTPDAVALVFENEHLTYRELNKRANRLAHKLISLGVGPETLVGVYMERSLEMVISLYGILKAGGAYVPLDPDYPPERVAFMIEDAELPVLLTQPHLRGSLPDHEAQVVCLDSQLQSLEREKDDNPHAAVAADNLAYAIYTSGSTGKPKGVLVSHRNVVNFFTGMDRHISGETPGVWLAVTSISFDISVLELFWTLAHGFTVVLFDLDSITSTIKIQNSGSEVRNPSESMGNNGDDLSAVIHRHGITHLQSTPSMAQMVISDPECLNSLRSLKKLILGGEALPPSLVKVMQAVVSGEIYNMYGPTETTIWSTVHHINNVNKNDSAVPIGRPVANTELYILDRSLQPVPIGVPGELFIGGQGVVRGYLNRPELTAEKFIPDPFSNKSGALLYKTGDLTRYLPDGNIEFLGRLDHQVKISGYRIELGEIESALGQLPAVREAVVIVREDTPGNKRLVAYLTTKTESTSSVSELQGFLKKTLPDFMIPSSFVFLKALPFTPNGKVNRHALPIPDAVRPEQEKKYDAPRSSVEKALAKIWTQGLAVEKIGIHDNFFELGGNSLAAVQIAMKISHVFNVEFPIRTIFATPTLAGLAGELEEKLSSKTKKPNVYQLLSKVKQISEKEAKSIIQKKEKKLS